MLCWGAVVSEGSNVFNYFIVELGAVQKEELQSS